MSNTKYFYNQNAFLFFENTFHVDMKNIYEIFLKYVPIGGKILDVGCGSGRDALYFKNAGFDVDAFDYSESLVQLAKEKTGLNIGCQSFYDLDVRHEYDGIWACASLLHCDRGRLHEVMQKIINALKVNGIGYISFKYGEEDRIHDGRIFTDLNEIQAHELLASLDNVQLLQQWVTLDNRPNREEKWLNLIIQHRSHC